MALAVEKSRQQRMIQTASYAILGIFLIIYDALKIVTLILVATAELLDHCGVGMDAQLACHGVLIVEIPQVGIACIRLYLNVGHH